MKIPNSFRKGMPNKLKKRYAVILRDGANCKHCNDTDSNNLTVDHVLPTVLGGADDPGNMQILCVTCHREKDKHLAKKAHDFKIVKEMERLEKTSVKKLGQFAGTMWFEEKLRNPRLI